MPASLSGSFQLSHVVAQPELPRSLITPCHAILTRRGDGSARNVHEIVTVLRHQPLHAPEVPKPELRAPPSNDDRQPRAAILLEEFTRRGVNNIHPRDVAACLVRGERGQDVARPAAVCRLSSACNGTRHGTWNSTWSGTCDGTRNGTCNGRRNVSSRVASNVTSSHCATPYRYIPLHTVTYR